MMMMLMMCSEYVGVFCWLEVPQSLLSTQKLSNRLARLVKESSAAGVST